MTLQIILGSIVILFLLIVVFVRNRLSVKNNIILTLIGLILISTMFSYRLTLHFSYSRLAILLAIIIGTLADVIKKYRTLREDVNQ
jgi:hypothetical protein